MLCRKSINEFGRDNLGAVFNGASMTATSLNLTDVEVTVTPAHSCGAKMAGRRAVSAFALPPHTALTAQLMQHRRLASQHTVTRRPCALSERRRCLLCDVCRSLTALKTASD